MLMGEAVGALITNKDPGSEYSSIRDPGISPMFWRSTGNARPTFLYRIGQFVVTCPVSFGTRFLDLKVGSFLG